MKKAMENPDFISFTTNNYDELVLTRIDVAERLKLFGGANGTMGLRQFDERMKICRECPELKRKILGSFCNVCGCNMKLKTQVPSAECPLKKW
jgi:hypothetical protein